MEHARKSLPWYWWTVAGWVLLAGYPLSLVPASYLADREFVSKEILIGYAPLLFAWETFHSNHEMPAMLADVEVQYALYFRDGRRLRRYLMN